MEKDKIEIEKHKKLMIEDIKKLDKNKLFEVKPKNKISIINKLITILGYGKKG